MNGVHEQSRGHENSPMDQGLQDQESSPFKAVSFVKSTPTVRGKWLASKTLPQGFTNKALVAVENGLETVADKVSSI